MMLEGLLWFDNDPGHDLTIKIKQAAKRYRTRLKQRPTICYLNPKEYDASIDDIDGIALKSATNIQPHYLLISTEH